MHADWLKVFPTDSHWIAGFLHILVTHHRRERNCPCPCNKCRTGKISKFCVKNNDVTWHQNILSAGSAIQCQWVASLFFFVFLLFFCWQCRFLFLVWDSIYIHHFFSFGWCIRWLNNGWTSIFRRYSMNDLLNELETFVKTVNEYQQSPNWGADIWTWLMRLIWNRNEVSILNYFLQILLLVFFRLCWLVPINIIIVGIPDQNTVNQLWLSLSLSLSVSWCIWFWILISTPLLQYPVL